jgi:hypothetical protein
MNDSTQKNITLCLGDRVKTPVKQFIIHEIKDNFIIFYDIDDAKNIQSFEILKQPQAIEPIEKPKEKKLKWKVMFLITHFMILTPIASFFFWLLTTGINFYDWKEHISVSLILGVFFYMFVYYRKPSNIKE